MKITLTRWSKLPVANKSFYLVLFAMIAGTVPAFAADDTLEVDGFIENATNTREHRGLSKVRNTVQFEFLKQMGNTGFFSNVTFNATLRGTYDAVYDLNDDEFGSKAGGAILIDDQVAGPVSHGLGLGSSNPASPYFGAPLPPGNVLGFDVANNPNEGLEVLGQNLHAVDGGVSFGVPVRPCNVDSRGCIAGYMNQSENNLRFPEFNNRLDFIREAYFDANKDLDSGTAFNLRLGKQQIVWGRTDLFRVLDVINPVDFSRNNIYDELEDIRIPLWSAAAEWQFGANDTFDDINFQMVWVFDKFRPNNLGQGGTPNQILDAGSFFRGMKNCWDNGCTVSNFANGTIATDFGPHQIGIRQANMPKWSLANSQFGIKVEGVYKDVGFSLNALRYRSQLPSLRGGIPSTNSFTGQTDTVFPYLISFDIDFPQITLFGGSLDFYSDTLKTAFRVEAAYTSGEEFANTLKPRLFSKSDVIRWVIGIDHNLFIRAINKNKAFLISFQTFEQRLLDHETQNAPLGIVGMPDWKVDHISTLLIKGWWMNDRLSPQILSAYDWRAHSGVVAPSVDFLMSDNWRFSLVANIKFGDGAKKFSDCRTCNPFTPFTATPIHTDNDGDGLPDSFDAGLGGFEPLGRFRAGPLGMANNENEIQLTVRYRFD
ncbi:MAG TPA: DUF1302 family protein [Aeromonadales bacterium]|nr:DUF1302 family protein [Aeromonadales bacterium]